MRPAITASILLLVALGCGDSTDEPCRIACFRGCESVAPIGCACPPDSTPAPVCNDAAMDASAPADAGSDAGSDAGQPDPGMDTPTCPRVPGAADDDRKVVVAHPYDAAGAQDDRYEVLDLSQSGELSRPGVEFELGRAFGGEIVFTPDGEVGLIAQDDGTIGVFRFDETGAPVVVDAGFDGPFYASAVVMDPAGTHAYVIDSEWRNIGGGIYRIDIGCDGTLSDGGLLVAAKLPRALALRGDRAVLAADDALTSAMDLDVHLLSWGETPELNASTDAFPDDDAIGAGAALTADGTHFLLGDNSEFSGVDNRVAVVRVEAAGVTGVQVLGSVLDPVSIITSPFDDVALIASGFGNALFVVDYDPSDAVVPFRMRGQLTYVGASPQLPGAMVLLARGSLEGLVLLTENLGVRRIRLEGGGSVTDLGLTSFGSGLENIAGAIGVQP